jgi:hypothetical protein
LAPGDYLEDISITWIAGEMNVPNGYLLIAIVKDKKPG